MTAKHTVGRVVAATAAIALVGGLATAVATPALAMPADLREVAAGKDIFTPVSDRLPAVESALEWGSPLAADPGARVSLPGLSPGNTGALVRISLAASTDPRTIYTGTTDHPVAVLTAPAGQAVSMTTLLRVTDGTAPLWSSAKTDARVEVTAGLDGSAPRIGEDGTLLEAGTPGSTITLDEPVTFADSGSGLGGSAIAPSTPMDIGITGVGGIPTTDVRAAYAAVTVDLTQAADLTIDGAALHLPAGVTSFTTLVTPNEQGLISAEIDGGSASMHLDVLGWMPNADEFHSTVNVTGGFDVASDRDIEFATPVGRRPATVPITDVSEGGYVLMLAQTGTSTQNGFLDFGAAPSGRATGAVVDAKAGAIPQLLLASAADIEQVHLSRGTSVAGLHLIGEFLGEPAKTTETDSQVKIDSVKSGAAIDLNEQGFFELGGSLTLGEQRIDHVEVAIAALDAPGFNPADYPDEIGTDGYLGNADVFVNDDGQLRFSTEVGAPVDGSYRYTVTMVDRAGERASTSIEVQVTAVAEDAETVNPNAVVVNGTGGTAMGATDDGRVVSFTELPEDLTLDSVIVSGVAAGFADGFIGRVESITRQDDLWLVRTSEGALGDIVLNSAIDEVLEFNADTVEQDPESLAPVAGEAGEDPLEVTITDPETGETLTRDDVTYENQRVGTGEIITGEDAVFAHEKNSSGVFAENDNSVAGSWDKEAALEVNPVFYLMVGDGEGKSNVIVRTMTNASEEQTQNILSRIVDHPVDGLFEAMIRANVKTKANVHIALDVALKKKLKFIPAGVKVNEFTVRADVVAGVGVEVAANGSAERKVTLAEPLKRTETGSFTVYLGPIPIVVKNYVTLTIDAEAKIQANVHVRDLRYDRTISQGFTYTSDKGMSVISGEGRSQFTTPKVTALNGKIAPELSGELAVGPTVKTETLLYGVAGPQLLVKPRANVSGVLTDTVTPPNTHNLALKVRAWASVEAKFSGKLRIHKWDIVNIDAASPKKEWEIWRHTWFWTVRGSAQPPAAQNLGEGSDASQGEDASGESDVQDRQGDAPDNSDENEEANPEAS